MSANVRSFGRPRPSQISGGGGLSFLADVTFVRRRPPENLPPPTGPSPFRLDLADVVSAEVIDAITSARKMVFHVAGDTGGVKSPEPQQIVVNHMEQDLKKTPPQSEEIPVFFYMLGDCVYYNGAEADYYPQFYQPYEFYNAPIFAVPGNHDGDLYRLPPRLQVS